jgi:hypothetical protein
VRYVIQISLRLPEELLAKIDEARGMVPRNRLLVTILEQHFASMPSVPVASVRVSPKLRSGIKPRPKGKK